MAYGAPDALVPVVLLDTAEMDDRFETADAVDSLDPRLCRLYSEGLLAGKEGDSDGLRVGKLGADFSDGRLGGSAGDGWAEPAGLEGNLGGPPCAFPDECTTSAELSSLVFISAGRLPTVF